MALWLAPVAVGLGLFPAIRGWPFTARLSALELASWSPGDGHTEATPPHSWRTGCSSKIPRWASWQKSWSRRRGRRSSSSRSRDEQNMGMRTFGGVPKELQLVLVEKEPGFCTVFLNDSPIPTSEAVRIVEATMMPARWYICFLPRCCGDGHATQGIYRYRRLARFLRSQFIDTGPVPLICPNHPDHVAGFGRLCS